MYKYVCPPIDRFWGCITLKDFLTQILENYEPGGCGGLEETLNELIHTLVKEMKTIDAWEGDIREGIYVFGLPPRGFVSSTTEYGFIWKQDNNGTTFVLSPTRLPWMDKYEVKHYEIEVSH